MVDKLKCPFCGEELEYDWYEYENGRGDTEYAKSGLLKCPDWDCRGYKLKLEPEIWQALIDGKKAQDALKVATDALSKIDAFNCHNKGAMEVIAGMATIANGALYEITSITKQEI